MDINQKRETVCYIFGSKGHLSCACCSPLNIYKLLHKLCPDFTKFKAKKINFMENLEEKSYFESPDFTKELD